MKKISIALLSSMMSISGWSACTYNFNATQKEISSYHDLSDFEKFPSIVNQKTSFTIKENIDLLGFLAANGDHLTNKSKGVEVPKNGIFAYEYKIKVPTELLHDKEGMIMYPNFADAYYDGGKDQIVLMYANHLIGSTTPNKISFAIGIMGNKNPQAIELPVKKTSDGYQ